ncbi:hypothetical protein KLP28_08020 [Nocardioidaceae bacterium]|nr:hypothetical protein KLP28_08020 [Nocardioidaceae bacterium]
MLAGVLGHLVAPRLVRSEWTRRAPGQALAAWVVLLTFVIVSLMLVGVALVVPHVAPAHDFSGLLHMCTELFGGHLDSTIGALSVVVGTSTTVVLAIRVAMA